MKKSDLITGNKVKLRNGMEFLVLLNCIVSNKEQSMLIGYDRGCLDLSMYDENLLRIERAFKDEDYDIMSIYMSHAPYCIIVANENWELIWERKEAEPMKIAEALKIYNIGTIIKSLVNNEEFFAFGCKSIYHATDEQIDGDWIEVEGG